MRMNSGGPNKNIPPNKAMSDHDEAAIFHQGIALFNDGEWFDAHEEWEDIWVMASDQKKRFYQGLIQCAVTLEHIRRGNPRGVRSVWKSCVPKFDGITGIYMGIDVPKLLSDMRAVVDPILNLPASRFDPAIPRGQDLPFDPNKVPKIELLSDPFAGENEQ